MVVVVSYPALGLVAVEYLPGRGSSRDRNNESDKSGPMQKEWQLGRMKETVLVPK